MIEIHVGLVILLCSLTFGIGYCVGWLEWRKAYKLSAEALKIAKNALISANGRLEIARAGWRRIGEISMSRLTPAEKKWMQAELAKTGDPNFLNEGGQWKWQQ